MSAGERILGEAWNLPREVSEVQGKDPGTWLQFNTHMVTFYQQTYGELSRFFLALREGRLIGSRCPRCRQVNVPAATWHCPTCDFVEMSEVELPHRGLLAATAPITIFPSASFLSEAPFARGYVDVALDAPIASFLPGRLVTTTGLPRPGIFVRGVELKLVFEDQRQGTIRDVFWVPMAEVPPALREETPLLASRLDFARPAPPRVLRTPAGERALAEALSALRELSARVERSPRARKDLAGREHRVAVATGGGDFTLVVSGGGLGVEPGAAGKVDFTVVAEEPAVFSRWVADGSLTDAAVEGKLWLPHRQAFALLPILDRLPRSVRRDLGEGRPGPGRGPL